MSVLVPLLPCISHVNTAQRIAAVVASLLLILSSRLLNIDLSTLFALSLSLLNFALNIFEMSKISFVRHIFILCYFIH